jgi:hypothetical protein
VSPVLRWPEYLNLLGLRPKGADQVIVESQQCFEQGALDFRNKGAVTRIGVVVHVTLSHPLYAPAIRLVVSAHFLETVAAPIELGLNGAFVNLC